MSVLIDVERYINDRVVLSDQRFLLPLALWAAHTHAWDVEVCGFNATPYLNFVGQRGTGKNHIIHVMGSLSDRFLFVAKATEAALRDTVDHDHPTLGVAECEDDLKKHNSYIHRLFNSGNVPNEPFYKVVSGVATPFQVFCPKMMATIGNVEESLHSRCIVVPTIHGNPKVDGDDFSRGRSLARELHTLVMHHAEEISQLYGSKTLRRPERLEARDWQILKPLYAVCGVLDPARLSEYDRCATYLAAIKTRPLVSVKDMHALHADATFTKNSQRALKDAAAVVSNYLGKNIASEELCKRLVAMDHGWWEGYGSSMNGKLVTLADGQRGQQLLAKMFATVTDGQLRPSDNSIHISQGHSARGYVVAEIKAYAAGGGAASLGATT